MSQTKMSNEKHEQCFYCLKKIYVKEYSDKASIHRKCYEENKKEIDALITGFIVHENRVESKVHRGNS